MAQRPRAPENRPRHRKQESGGRHRPAALAALSSLFEYLCEKNAVSHNPVKGVKRPRAESGEGKTPAIGDHQARELLTTPGEKTIKEKRDRAILSTLLFHALRREELCKLKVKDLTHVRRGVPHLNVSGKGEKTRYLPLHSGHQRTDPRLPGGCRPRRGRERHTVPADPEQPHRPARQGAHTRRGLQAGAGVFSGARFRDRRPRAARDGRHQCARSSGRHRQAKVQEWLGHANIATTRIYDHRKMRRRIVPHSRLITNCLRD
jgi:integrase/recombinase XerD